MVVLESIHEGGIEELKRHAEVHQLSGPGDERLVELLSVADALIVRSTRIDRAMLSQASSLRVLGRHGAGLDNIDLEYTQAHGIRVVNTPRSNTESVAEYVITVMLMLLKRIPEVSHGLRSGVFIAGGGSLPGQVDRAGLIGREANGLVLGLVGAGAIGRSVARRAQALGLVVRAYDPYLSTEQLIELGIEPAASLEDLLGSVDVVSLHVPGGNVRPLIGARELAVMRKGALLINAARGELLDGDALVAALDAGDLAGAAVDVYATEPPAVVDPLLHHELVIATPHMAAMTAEALERMSLDVATAVVAALDE